MAGPKISFVLLNVDTINSPKVAQVSKGEAFIVTNTNTLYWRNAFSGTIEPLSASGDAPTLASILANTETIKQNQQKILDEIARLSTTVTNEAQATRTHVTDKTKTITTNMDTSFSTTNQKLTSQDVVLARIDANTK